MPYLPQQQQPGPIPALDDLEGRIHPFTAYVLAIVFGVGGFFYGLDHPSYPLALFIGLGVIVGLLAVALLKHLAAFLILVVLVGAAGVGTFWLFDHTSELQHRHAVPAAQTASSAPVKASSHSLLDDLRKAVE